MAFDGITIANIIQECREKLIGARIYKIAQPEADELLLTFKAPGGQYRLVLSADASLPLIYLTQENKQSPMTAPNFCMLLRKHIQNGRIVDITQPGLERIMRMEIEHLDEMGDLCRKVLVIEIMGKHSNIIFLNDEEMIIDSIKHISAQVSSVREVLPGRTYFIPQTQNKLDPIAYANAPDERSFAAAVFGKAYPTYKAIYSSFTGISPILAQEICYRSGVDADRAANTLDGADEKRLSGVFLQMMKDVQAGRFAPAIVYENGQPKDYAAVELTMYAKDQSKPYDSISELLQDYYREKNTITRIRQKSADLRKIVSTALERTVKKYDLQCSQIRDTEKREKYRIYGELLHTYGYEAKQGDKELKAINYYDGQEITIPLDPQQTPAENAKKYFDKYNKMKRTYETLTELTKDVEAEIEHLRSIATSLDIALQESDLTEIKEELTESGYIKRKGGAKREKILSKPFHYVSSDGFDIYVGKNNYQNEYLTFKFAIGNDMWFHAKGMPGSHVIVKTGGKELPDRTYEEAARLAAYYSQGRGAEKVEIDYSEKKNIKKPPAARPGFVIYHTNYSMVIDSNIAGITCIST
ncbi:MAG: NFACT family protein [Lachnospiraceae bacterium]|nr:NFACT family protein [Lachnospiraceae bacterium]